MKTEIFVVGENESDIFDHLYCGDLKKEIKSGVAAMSAISMDEDNEVEPTPSGLILFDYEDELVFIKWLYIKPAFRGSGVASKLLTTLKKWAKYEGAQGIFSYYSDPELDLVFNVMGFNTLQSKTVEFESTINDIIDIPDAEKTDGIMWLKDVPDTILNAFNHSVQVKNLHVYTEMPIVPTNYMEESIVYINETEIEALVLLKKADGGINISCVYVEKGKEVALIKIISYLKNEMIKKYPGDTKVIITAINDQSLKLTGKLLPHAQSKYLYEAYYSC